MNRQNEYEQLIRLLGEQGYINILEVRPYATDTFPRKWELAITVKQDKWKHPERQSLILDGGRVSHRAIHALIQKIWEGFPLDLDADKAIFYGKIVDSLEWKISKLSERVAELESVAKCEELERMELETIQEAQEEREERDAQRKRVI